MMVHGRRPTRSAISLAVYPASCSLKICDASDRDCARLVRARWRRSFCVSSAAAFSSSLKASKARRLASMILRSQLGYFLSCGGSVMVRPFPLFGDERGAHLIGDRLDEDPPDLARFSRLAR